MLNEDVDDRVINIDSMNGVLLHHGRYSESFVSTSLLLAEIYTKKNKTYSDHARQPKIYPTTQGHP